MFNFNIEHENKNLLIKLIKFYIIFSFSDLHVASAKKTCMLFCSHKY